MNVIDNDRQDNVGVQLRRSDPITIPTDWDTDAGGIFCEPRTLTNGLTGVNPVQLYLDFTLHQSRDQELANFLVEHALGFRE